MPESLESKSNTKKKKKKRSPSDNPSATEDADSKTKRNKQETETVESSTMSMIGDKFRAAGILFYEKRGNHCKALLGVQTKQFKLSILVTL